MGRHITAPVLPRVAALYCRVSTKRQAGLTGTGDIDDEEEANGAVHPDGDKTSLKTQLQALQAKAAALGYTTAPEWTYQDAFTGEELHQRPALSQLRQDARAGHFGLVLAYNVYALAKNQAHMAILLDEMEQLGIGLDFVTEQLENTPLGRLVLSARAFAAEVEGERRRDRMQRALVAQVHSGHMPPSARAPYGYQWPDERRASGALRRDRLERNPMTWPLLERIWGEALSGRTQRAIAAALSAEGVTTPSGHGTRWDPNVIHYILHNPVYWGKPVALRRKLVPVAPAVRSQYRHKSRAVRRAVEDHVPLPDDFAPPVVTPEAAAYVHQLATMNKWLATPQNPEPQELLRGIAKCGYCQNRLIVGRSVRERADGTPAPRSTYKCGKGTRIADACGHHGIEAHKLDAAVWAAFGAELRNPVRIRAEVERMRQTGDPSAATVEAIDRNLDSVRRQIANKRKYIDMATDDRELEETAAEITTLRQRERALEAERAATFAHYADWQATQDGLERILDWCERVSGNLDRFTFAERRETLLILKAEVLLYKADRYPRVELAFSLPLSGEMPLTVDDDGGVLVRSTSRR